MNFTTEISSILPHFPLGQYADLVPALEKHRVLTSELLTHDVAEIGKRTQLPLLDIKQLRNAVVDALHRDLGGVPASAQETSPGQRHSFASLDSRWQTISTLDQEMDRVLGGGVPAGYLVEVTGESGTGKTQFLLALLLAVQLPPPHGLGRPALYISTEASLPTRRLVQMLAAHPALRDLGPHQKPSLDAIGTIAPRDLESQDHILTYQVPTEVARRNVGLVVLDSVAANYRAELNRGGAGMAARSAGLVRLGMQLRNLAQTHNLAVVVANQVADRFGGGLSIPPAIPRQSSQTSPSQSSPLASRSRGPAAELSDTTPGAGAPWPPALLLDHQQRWITGWGDDPDPTSFLSAGSGSLKTPALGLVWTKQLAMRIALLKRDAQYYGNKTQQPWRRWLKVVFAPHAAASGPGVEGAVEVEITAAGMRGYHQATGEREGESGGEKND